MAKGSGKKHPNGSALGFEAQLWAAADKTVGVAGFVMVSGSMFTQTLNEREALPGQLFFMTQIPVCLWFLARDKTDSKRRNRRGETQFAECAKLEKAIGQNLKALRHA